jgi:hypothetical protein
MGVPSIVAIVSDVPLEVFRGSTVTVPFTDARVSPEVIAAVIVTVVTVVEAAIVMALPIRRRVDDGNAEQEGQREGRPKFHARASTSFVICERGEGRSQSNQHDQQGCCQGQRRKAPANVRS